MRRHMEVNHDGVRYKCKMCDKVYTKNSSLTKHMSRSHVTCDLKPACWFLNTFFWPFLAFFGHNTSISLSIFWPSVTGCDLCNGRQAATSLGAHSGWGEVKMPVSAQLCSQWTSSYYDTVQCISRTYVSVQYTDCNAGNSVQQCPVYRCAQSTKYTIAWCSIPQWNEERHERTDLHFQEYCCCNVGCTEFEGLWPWEGWVVQLTRQ